MYTEDCCIDSVVGDAVFTMRSLSPRRRIYLLPTENLNVTESNSAGKVEEACEYYLRRPTTARQRTCRTFEDFDLSRLDR